MTMESTTAEPGRILTFYSYKGGTGRSMAVANVACLLSQRLARTSQRVLMMDWDLEAPGLHRYFSAKSDLPEYDNRPGVINYFQALLELLRGSPKAYQELTGAGGWRLLDERLPLENYLIPDVIPGVDLMRAGRFDAQYPRLVGSFNWMEFYDQYKGVIRTFQELLSESYAYTLVDSRTGITDVSGICTTLLPEKLVGVFVPNKQNLHGLRDIVAQAIEYRSKSDDFRPLSVFPLPSRIENAEEDLKQQWRKEYQREFEALFEREYGTTDCDLSSYFNDVLLPHKSYFAYGEKIAVFEERPDAVSLNAAYQRFFDRLMNQDFPWELPETAPQPVMSPAAEVSTRAAVLKYDAYLGCIPEDAKAVARIEAQLAAAGVRCFLEARDIPPGEDRARSTAAGMNESKAIVVFVGPSGVGPWQDQQSLAILENFAKDGSKRIVPVLLPKAGETMRLPNFLRTLHWVNMREGIKSEQVDNLVWALTGERPTAKKSGSLGLAGRYAPVLLVAPVAVLLLLVALVPTGWRYLHSHSGSATSGSTTAAPNSSTNSGGAAANPANPQTIVNLAIWDKQVPAQGWCYQELGTDRSAAWALKTGLYGAYCHFSADNCAKARSSATTASECAFVDGLNMQTWGGIPLPKGYLDSWYQINMRSPLPAPFPQLTEQSAALPGGYGIVVSADKTWSAESPGGPSAEYEVQWLQKFEAQEEDGILLKNSVTAEYYKDGSYRTVLDFQQGNADLAKRYFTSLQSLKPTGVELVTLGSWCSNPQQQPPLIVNGVSIPYVRCGAASGLVPGTPARGTGPTTRSAMPKPHK